MLEASTEPSMGGTGDGGRSAGLLSSAIASRSMSSSCAGTCARSATRPSRRSAVLPVRRLIGARPLYPPAARRGSVKSGRGAAKGSHGSGGAPGLGAAALRTLLRRPGAIDDLMEGLLRGAGHGGGCIAPGPVPGPDLAGP
ncbi:MAG TPA: hypothetical protein VM580_05665 [Labilithrix sp.]|jgi:hypothetical protein|nr:hypothetical protein [Labilithrix sp.]